MKKFGLLGERLGHSFSVPIHKSLGCENYGLIETPPDKLKELLSDTSVGGLNVTIPYKREVMKYCSRISDEAKAIGSVNTLVRGEDGKFCAYNTDRYGFEYMLRRAGIEVADKKIIVLGNGGTSRTAVFTLSLLGAGEVIVLSRNAEQTFDAAVTHRDADIIVNTTPVGMYPEAPAALLNLSDFPSLGGVADVIYNPARTALLMHAETLGIPHTGGLPMLVAQAKAAEELFFGKKLDDRLIEDIINKIRAETENIVLVGMPGCGKSSIGRRLAQRTGREFFDIDSEIEKTAGESIPSIINYRGEDAFRALETAEIARLGKESGKIIATGGGAVTRLENYSLLHQNGRIVYISRELSKLELDGRPLSKDRQTLEKMFETRLPMYRLFSDAEVINREISAAADEIIKMYGLEEKEVEI